MRLILINTNPLPAPDPPSLQVINNSTALARQAELHLIARRGLAADIETFYGLKLPAGLHLHLLPGLTVNRGWLRLSWNLPFFLLGLSTIVRLCRQVRVDALLVRNLKLAEFLLVSNLYERVRHCLCVDRDFGHRHEEKSTFHRQ